LKKIVSIMSDERDSNCLVCLADTTTSPASCVIRCPNNHPLHAQCALRMLALMGKNTCPYCTGRLEIAPLINSQPSAWTRAKVLVEHGLYMWVMCFLVLFSAHSSPLPWKLSWTVAKLRWRYEHFNIHAEGLEAIRAWVRRKIMCIALALVLVAVEEVLHALLGDVYTYSSAFVYGFLIVMYGNRRGN
jgi:hypothetical protein